MSEKPITKKYLLRQLENFYTKVIASKISGASGLSIIELSSDSYSALSDEEKNDASKIYFVK